ncbi:MAG TPA: protein kinase [Gemmataceae bacterium]|nr:protein kinase [Gemmataceae bacterium]
MSASSADRNPVEKLAEEFAERYRRGERPSLTDYVQRYPQHADEIRELFPALVAMEQLKPAPADATGAFEGSTDAGTTRALERLGDYRIVREVGRGGMGVVYEAEQVSLGRHVALKVLPPQTLLNPTYLERFRREAKAAARLHHTNIVPVYGVGEEDGVYFYAMQFIRGEGLDRVLHDLRRLRGGKGGDGLLAGTPFEASLAHELLSGQFAAPRTTAAATAQEQAAAAPVGGAEANSFSALSSGGTEAAFYRSVARVGLQVADALAYAHRQGVVHRDVKPSNLLLDAQGTVWVTDFGLAKAEGADDLTHSGDIVGTLRFMAPERFDGRSLPQSDVYSLGLTLYELLTLRPAFDDTNKGRLIDKVLHEPPAPPRRLDPRVPRDLETVVLKCLAKDPTERYPTADALAEDLRRFLADRPVRARRASSAERLWRWARRNPAVASLLGCVALLLVTVAIVSTFSAAQMNASLVKTKEAEREARLREAEALVGQAHGIRYSHRVGQRFETLAALQKAVAIGRELGQPPEWFDRLRNEAIACLALPDWRPLREWDGIPPGTHNWDCDDRHRLYAWDDLHGHITVRRVDTDEEIAPLDGFPGDNWLSVSPDGLFLLCGEGPQRRVWDLASSPPALIVERKSGSYGHAFHPDGRHMALAGTEGAILLYDLTSPHQPPQLLDKLGDGPATQMTFDPLGNKLAVAPANGRVVHVLDSRSGKALATPWRPKAPLLSLAWHPASQFLAAACGDHRIHVWDPARGQEVAVLEGWRSGGIRIAFTPEGEFVVSNGWEGKLRFWHWRTGQQVLSHPAGSNLRFSPDGRLIIQEGNRLKLIEVAVGREYRTLVQQSSPGKDLDYWGGAVHPDGRLLAGAMSDGARLWDLETGDEVARIGPNAVWGVAFTFEALLTNGPDGLFLWPIRHDVKTGTPGQIGPPRLLNGGTATGISCSSDGQLIAQPISNGALVLHRDHTERSIWLGPQQDVRGAWISPDGRLVATFTHRGGVKIWETEHRQLVKGLSWAGPPAFSPDGKRLAVSAAEGGRILTVGTWEEGPAIPSGVMAFSPDGNLLAVDAGQGVILLLDPATGHEKARLEDPHQDVANWLGFTPDGTRLVAVSDDGKAIHVWDLKRIRAELARLGLDWDASPYPERADPAPGSLEVRVVGAESLAKLPEAMALNNQAWRLVTGPEGQRNPARALELIQQAIERQPDNPLFLNTLGVAQYRNGQYAAAVVTLEKSLAAGKGQADGFDLFFLAMCQARVGEPAKAKDCFDRAVNWMERQKDLPGQAVEELKTFRAEAEEALRQK